MPDSAAESKAVSEEEGDEEDDSDEPFVVLAHPPADHQHGAVAAGAAGAGRGLMKAVRREWRLLRRMSAPGIWCRANEARATCARKPTSRTASDRERRLAVMTRKAILIA